MEEHETNENKGNRRLDTLNMEGSRKIRGRDNHEERVYEKATHRLVTL